MMQYRTDINDYSTLLDEMIAGTIVVPGPNLGMNLGLLPFTISFWLWKWFYFGTRLSNCYHPSSRDPSQ